MKRVIFQKNYCKIGNIIKEIFYKNATIKKKMLKKLGLP